MVCDHIVQFAILITGGGGDSHRLIKPLNFRITRYGTKPQNRTLLYTVGYALNGCKTSPSPAIHLKGQWLKAAVFETGFTFTVKILNGCLVLIPDSEDTRAIKLKMRELIKYYTK
ncbi:type I toxin-antitoxin system SymE family toxin [Providencia stuartii]